MNNLQNIARQFIGEGKIVKVENLGEGNINQTFLVTVDSKVAQNFVLQQINTRVFTRPKLVMDNITLVTDRIDRKLASQNNFNWQVPQVLLTSENKHHYLDSNGGFWRAISFIRNTKSFNTIDNLDRAREIGLALGTFHDLISDLDVALLADTLPGFHITPEYLKQYQRAISITKITETTEVKYCHNFIRERLDFVDCLEKAKAKNILKVRPIHGDPKMNNIMFDLQSNKAVAIIDLDTVKPGLIHYDLGDCLRSSCNLLGEETQDWQLVNFDLESARAVLQGYLEVANQFITSEEINYIYNGIRLLAFELGLRFFTDYLNNNIYFHTSYPKHNLMRALVQFQLTKSIESQEGELKLIINESSS